MGSVPSKPDDVAVKMKGIGSPRHIIAHYINSVIHDDSQPGYGPGWFTWKTSFYGPVDIEKCAEWKPLEN